ncbi:MAG: 2-isopropylmalate synthase [Planctomycetes bacterium RBG_16_55_9]|nr:MAG: 2-isopropylmalate synthase [Planctomycetes bacterium RBG_16_55_9]
MSKEKVQIFDTTLRDGEQAAGTRLGAREKLEIARQLVRLNVDIIEAGFPASSPEDFEAVRLICEQIEGPVICGLTRARIDDIEVCQRALAKAKRARIHTGIGVSEIHIAGKFADDKYGKTMGAKQAMILKMAVEAVRHTAQYVKDIEFYAEDSGRADRKFLYEILEAVIDAGATVLNIPDTTGYSIPEQYGALIRDIRANVPNVSKATISVHCHDDLGMAVANSLAGVKNGARQVEGTINGVGERAGNAAIEEVVMAIHTRRDFFDEVETNINTREFYRTSRMVSDMLGMPVPANKAVVGHNAFAHSSGIHVDGFLKKRETYEIMRPEDIGLDQSRVVLTARTGRHGLRHRLEEMGYKLSKEELDKTYERFLAVADKKKEVFNEDLAAIISDEIHTIEQIYELAYLHVACGTGTLPTASVKMKTKDGTKQAAACGDGPVDAAYEAIRQATGLSPKLENYSIRAVTSGKDALGEATVRIIDDSRTFIGRGISTDIIEASAKAYVDAINRMVAVQRIAQEVKEQL